MGGGDGCNPWNVSSERQKNDYYFARWVGQIQSDDSSFSNSVYEAKGAIEVYSPWVSEGTSGGTNQYFGGSDVSEWVSVGQAPQTTTDGKGDTIFQAGWIEYYQGNRFNFAELDVPGHPVSIDLFNPDSINTTHWWDVKFNQGYLNPATDPMWTYQEDNAQTYWYKAPTEDYQFIPNEGEMAAESHATADQMPGGTGNHSWMGYFQVATQNNPTLHVASYNDFFPIWFWYGEQTYPDNSIQLWDYACSS